MSRLFIAVLLGGAAGVAACAQPPAVDTAPIGSDVQVTRQDGGLVEGRLQARSDRTVTVNTGRATREVPRAEVADVRVVDPSRRDAPPPAARFREVTVPEGTRLTLALATPASSETSRVEDRVEATLVDAVRVGDTEVLPAGARVRGVVSNATPAGKVKGRATLALHFTEVTAGDATAPMSARFSLAAPSTTKEDAMKIGLPAAGGALLGAIVGGKKGAAVGATIGGGGGAAAVVMTAGDPVTLTSGAHLAVSLERAIDVRVPIERRTASSGGPR